VIVNDRETHWAGGIRGPTARRSGQAALTKRRDECANLPTIASAQPTTMMSVSSMFSIQFTACSWSTRGVHSNGRRCDDRNRDHPAA